MNEELLRRSYERLLVIREQNDPDRDLCPSVDQIHAVVNREGSEASRLQRLDHVMQCPECRKEFDLLRSIELIRPPAPASNWRLWAFAATVVLVAGATVVWKMTQPRVDVLRGSSNQVTLVAPAVRAVVQPPVTFSWHPVPGALSYRVELLDAAGGATWSSEAGDTTLLLENLPVGNVTGWKVTAEFLNGVPLESAVRELRLAVPPPVNDPEE